MGPSSLCYRQSCSSSSLGRFGPIRGTVLVSLISAAAITATISRRVAASYNYGLAAIDSRAAAAVDASIATRPVPTSLLLVTVLRLSPVVCLSLLARLYIMMVVYILSYMF